MSAAMNARRAAVLALRLCLLGLALAVPAGAAEVRHFRADGRDELEDGELDGISLDPMGRLALADRVERVGSVDEPFLLAAARHPKGWVVGTGNAGKVVLIDRKGAVSILFTAAEPQVFAVRAEPDGTVYAATSPRGKVYRIPPGGEGAVFFDPGETYIWALERAADGGLLVATGTQGKLFEVDAAGKGTVLYDGDDTHLRSLAVLAGGDVLAGTADEGLILRIRPDGTARTLYDATTPEVVALAAGEGGEAWAAVINSEASLAEPEGARPPAAEGGPPARRASGGEGGSEPEPVVTVSEGGEAPPEPTPRPRPGGRGPRTEILRIAPSGLVETVWTFFEETAFTLLWQEGKLWVGTGLEGKLFAFDGTAMVLEKDVEERQIVALVAGDPKADPKGDPKGDYGRPAFATTNAAALFRFAGGAERRGAYTSQALDAGSIAAFGTLHWEGSVPKGAAIAFAARSGLSAEPDRTWTEWTALTAGEEIALSGLTRGRYVQWRAALSSGNGASPQLYSVDLSYRQENLKPVIRSLAALEPGQVLVPAGFNPGNQVFEPAHPSRDGIFTPLGEAATGDEGRQKTLWKKGYQTFRWEASDPNDDALRYRLDFQPAAGGDWLPVAEELDATQYAFDATVLPDGIYRFRLSAGDGESNGGDGLVATQVSEPVTVDHTPPALAGVKRQGDLLVVQVRDATSPLTEAVVSVDAGAWKPARPLDGLTDGRRESFEIPVPAKARIVLLRLTDAAFNVVTFDLIAELD